MRVLVACERHGRVRDAFIKKGHDAVSCDILCDATDDPGSHYHGDVKDIIGDGWDLMIAHPPCTYLTNAGARWFYDPNDKSKPHPDYPRRWEDRINAIHFFMMLKNANIKKICIENSQPSGYATRVIGKYDQKIQPWMFGEPYTKGACLWLKNLTPLVPTHKKPSKVIAKAHRESPGPDRSDRRSVTYQCIADAMADAWG